MNTYHGIQRSMRGKALPEKGRQYAWTIKKENQYGDEVVILENDPREEALEEAIDLWVKNQIPYRELRRAIPDSPPSVLDILRAFITRLLSSGPTLV